MGCSGRRPRPRRSDPRRPPPRTGARGGAGQWSSAARSRPGAGPPRPRRPRRRASAPGPGCARRHARRGRGGRPRATLRWTRRTAATGPCRRCGTGSATGRAWCARHRARSGSRRPRPRGCRAAVAPRRGRGSSGTPRTRERRGRRTPGRRRAAGATSAPADPCDRARALRRGCCADRLPGRAAPGSRAGRAAPDGRPTAAGGRSFRSSSHRCAARSAGLPSRNVTHSAPAESSRRFTVSHRSADTLIYVHCRSSRRNTPT